MRICSCFGNIQRADPKVFGQCNGLEHLRSNGSGEALAQISHESQNLNSSFAFFQLKAEMVLSSDGKSQLLLDLLHGEGTSVCHLPLKLQVFVALRSQGSSCRAWVQHGGSQCQNPPAEFLGMQSKGTGISATSTQSQLAPRAFHRELRTGATLPKGWLGHIVHQGGDHHSVLLGTLSHCFERGADTLKSIF